MERAVSFSVETVPAMLLPPAVGGAKSSAEYRPERLSSESSPVWCVEEEYSLYLCLFPWFSLTVPDSGYGLLSLFARRAFGCRFVRSFSEEFLKLVNFLTHVENGRRRGVWRSRLC